ncbi:hypothetical protein TUM1881_41020 [Escherichia coli]|nr:hypothetical protein TUM1881_41020 [Escherichia coli]
MRDLILQLSKSSIYSTKPQLWLSRGTGAYTYDWTPETRYGSMKSVSLQRIQPLTEQLNLGLTAGKVWYDTPTDDYNGLQLAAHLTWKF